MAANESEFTTWLLDDTKLPLIIEAFINETVEYHTKQVDEGYGRVVGAWSQAHCESMVKQVRENAGSPLERVFLLALMFGFVKADPFGLVPTPTFDTDAMEMIGRYRGDHKDAMAAIKKWKQHTGDKHLRQLITALSSDDPPFSNAGTLLRHVIGEVFGVSGSFQLTLQPKLTAIKVNGRAIRPDALVWIANDPSYLVVIECDGYEYHSDQAKFTSDRQRDRILAANGFRVLRVSGQEVFSKPIQTAVGVHEALDSFRRKRKKR